LNPLAPIAGHSFNYQIMSLKRTRIIFLLLAGLALIGGAGGWLFFRFARPAGAGPAGPVVARESFSQPWTNRRILLVGLGDSVTAGFGSRKGYSYFARLTKNPADEFPELNGICLSAIFPNLASTNLSVSGSTSAEVQPDNYPGCRPTSRVCWGLS